jgi:hypothetical protein
MIVQINVLWLLAAVCWMYAFYLAVKEYQKRRLPPIVQHVIDDIHTHCFTTSVSIWYFIVCHYDTKQICTSVTPNTITKQMNKYIRDSKSAGSANSQGEFSRFMRITCKYIRPADAHLGKSYFGHTWTMLSQDHKWYVLQSDYRVLSLACTHSITHAQCLTMLRILSQKVWSDADVSILYNLTRYKFDCRQPHHIVCDLFDVRQLQS